MPGWTVTVRSTTSISTILFISLTSTRIPPRSGTAPSVSPVPPARGTTGMRRRLASLTTSETCSAVVGSTTTSGMCSLQRCSGKGAGTRARLTPGRDAREDALRPDDLDQLVEDRVGERDRAHGAASSARPADWATSSIRSITSIGSGRSSPAAVSGRSDQTHALTSVSTSRAAARSTAAG